jgi:predicted dehydrogenase
VHAVILGAGGSGLLHALAFRAAGVHVAAVYDPDGERARLLADLCGAKVVDSLASATSVDAVIAAVCSPPSAHVEQAEALFASASERVVFVEKPVATTRAELERMRALPRCVPVLQWRAGRALRALRRVVELGELGVTPAVSCDLAWARDDDYLRARRGWGCGAVLSIGIHALDAMSWALGRVIESVAGLADYSRRIDGGQRVGGETAAVAALRFEGSAIGSLRISVDGGDDATRIAICGGGKTARLEGREADPTSGVLRWSSSNARDRERLEALERSTSGALGSPLLVPYLGAATRALRDGESPGESERLPSIADTFAAHAAAMHVAEPSSRTARPG